MKKKNANGKCLHSFSIGEFTQKKVSKPSYSFDTFNEFNTD